MSEEHPKPGLGWRHEIWRGPAVLCFVGAVGAASLVLQDWTHRRYFASGLWVVLSAISVWAGVRALQGRDWPPDTTRGRLLVALSVLVIGFFFLVGSIDAFHRHSGALAVFVAAFGVFFLYGGVAGVVQLTRGRSGRRRRDPPSRRVRTRNRSR